MTTKVKDTPILRGKDATRFNQQMHEADQKRISKQEYGRMLEVFKTIRIIEP